MDPKAYHPIGFSTAALYTGLVNWVARDTSLIEALSRLVGTHARWGLWKCVDRLRLDGHPWNHKRVWRVYRQLRLQLPCRAKKRVPSRVLKPLQVVPWPNDLWALDFMSDALHSGRRFRTVNILDEGVPERLAIEVDTSLPAEPLIWALEQVTAWLGLLNALRLDNGPELLAVSFLTCVGSEELHSDTFSLGSPINKPFIERSNRSYR